MIPHDGGPILLAGDETALPAMARIMEALPKGQDGAAIVAMPDGTTREIYLPPTNLDVTILPNNRFQAECAKTAEASFDKGGVSASPSSAARPATPTPYGGFSNRISGLEKAIRSASLIGKKESAGAPTLCKRAALQTPPLLIRPFSLAPKRLQALPAQRPPKS